MPAPKPRQHTEEYWREQVKSFLKGELRKQGVTYAKLAELLGQYGIEENEINIRNKISRGNFSAIFLFQCLSAVGVTLVTFKPALMLQGKWPEDVQMPTMKAADFGQAIGAPAPVPDDDDEST